MRTKTLVLALVLALLLFVASVALANGGVERPRAVLGGGATDSSASGVTLRATLGQPVVGLASSSGEITLGQGFWHGGSLPEGLYHVCLPLVTR
jgi:hypothetical protein